MIINSVIVKKGAEPTTGEGDYLVRYIDYDGTILKEQWVDSGENATPPADPSHSGLTFQEWNRASTNVTEDRDIGATYITSDGKTKVKIRLTTVSGKAPTLYLNKSDSSTLTIDWGDGTSNTYTNSGNFNVSHTYDDYGDYEITMWISSGSGTYTFGNGSNTTTFIGGSTQAYRNTLLHLLIGDDVTSIRNYAFGYCRSLTSVTIPNSVTSIGDNAFYCCYSLTSLTIPNSVTSIGDYAFYGCHSLTSVTIPNSVTSIGGYAFQYCYSLTSVVTIPNSVTSIGNNTFEYCCSLTSITIPNSVTSIGYKTFQYCYSLLEYIFERTTPPTLASTNAFTGINSICKIYVPDDSVSAYKSASNWSTYADYIYPISEK